MENYTFSSLGFENVNAILKPHCPKKHSRYSTLGINEPLSNVKNYLVQSLIDYIRKEKDGRINSFIAGIAYLRDDSAFMVYSGEGEYRSSLLSVHICQCDCGKNETVIGYIAKYINSKNPEGLILIQEIEPIKPGEYHFRVVHKNEEDREYNNIIKFPQKN